MGDADNTCCVATVRAWNIAQFEQTIRHYPGNWHLITDPADLTPDRLKDINLRAIFFPHWNWRKGA